MSHIESLVLREYTISEMNFVYLYGGVERGSQSQALRAAID